MLGDKLRCRRRIGGDRRVSSRVVLGPILLAWAGLAGGIVPTDVPVGRATEEPPARTTPVSAPAPPVSEAAPPAQAHPPETLPSEPPPAVDPIPPTASAPPPTSPESPQEIAAAPDRAPGQPPEPIHWTVSSEPLGASAPVRVDIPAVGASAPIDPLGLNPDGTLAVPGRFARAGWYTGRPTPGETGPAIVVAHRASRRGPGAFWHLPDVQPGQEVIITRADGSRVLFVVDRLEQHQKAAFPTEAVYGPTSETTLRLITCGGPFEPSLQDHYRDNVIVFARMAGWAPPQH